MDPYSALILVLLIATAVMAAKGDVITQAAMGAWDHGRAQAAAELRRARQEVYDRTSQHLRDKLDGGRKAGPASAWWWANAAFKAGRGTWRGLKGIRKGAEPDVMPAATPLRRIRDAAMAGARKRARAASDAARARRGGKTRREYARDQFRRNAQAWRRTYRRPEGTEGQTPTGVCDRCGATCARTALASAPSPSGTGTWMLCAHCRAIGQPKQDTPDPDPEPAGLERPKPAIDPAPATPEGAPLPIGEPSMAADLVVRRRGAPANGHAGHTVANAGDGQLTHGTWNRQQNVIAAAIEQARLCQQGMLANLTSVDAGRTQVAAILAWNDRVNGYLKFLEDGQAEINRRLGPVVEAVNTAGGPDEIAKTGHYADI